jgi:hypothetical protein
MCFFGTKPKNCAPDLPLFAKFRFLLRNPNKEGYVHKIDIP